MSELKYATSKEECAANICGVCSGCGGELVPLETVDNSRRPTFWAGCESCSRFDWGTPREIFETARALVVNDHQRAYSHLSEPSRGKTDEYEHWLRSQTSGMCGVVRSVLAEHEKRRNTPTQQPSPVAADEQVRSFIYSKDLYALLIDIQNGTDSPATCGMANGLLIRLDKLRATLASRAPVQQPAAEPVAWQVRRRFDGEWEPWYQRTEEYARNVMGLDSFQVRPLYTAPQSGPAQGDWMLVPRKITRAMADAGEHENSPGDLPDGSHSHLHSWQCTWTAMLAAAPTQPPVSVILDLGPTHDVDEAVPDETLDRSKPASTPTGEAGK